METHVSAEKICENIIQKFRDRYMKAWLAIRRDSERLAVQYHGKMAAFQIILSPYGLFHFCEYLDMGEGVRLQLWMTQPNTASFIVLVSPTGRVQKLALLPGRVEWN